MDANSITVPRNDSITIEVQADFNDIDDEAKTGGLFELTFYSLEAISASTGIDLDGTDITGVQEGDAAVKGDCTVNGGAEDCVTADEHQLVKTKPTLTTVSVGTSLDDGTEEELYAVKIAADAKDDVTVYQLAFEVNLSDKSDTDGGLTIDDYELADSSGEIDDYTCVDADAGNGGDTNTATVADGASREDVITCTYTGTAIETVNAGSSRTFYLRADISGSSDDDKITSSMKESYTDFAAADSAADVDTAGVTAIIWSDNSGTDESTTTDHWFGDEEVDGLNTASVSLEG